MSEKINNINLLFSQILQKEQEKKGTEKQLIFAVFAENGNVIVKPVLIDENNIIEPTTITIENKEVKDFKFHEIFELFGIPKNIVNNALKMIDLFIKV